jgi:antitoxin component HigA of HigAB toxin-antitoxin module
MEYRWVIAEIERLAEHEPDRASAAGRRLEELAALADGHEGEAMDAFLEDAERR